MISEKIPESQKKVKIDWNVTVGQYFCCIFRFVDKRKEFGGTTELEDQDLSQMHNLGNNNKCLRSK